MRVCIVGFGRLLLQPVLEPCVGFLAVEQVMTLTRVQRQAV